MIGRELKLNGGAGSLRLERTGRADLRAQITLAGTKVSEPTEACTVPLGDGQPIAAASQGRADGLPRYEVQAPVCPITFDVLDGAVLVKAPAEACVFQASGLPRGPAGHVGARPEQPVTAGARHRGCARHRRQGRARELPGARAEGRPARGPAGRCRAGRLLRRPRDHVPILPARGRARLLQCALHRRARDRACLPPRAPSDRPGAGRAGTAAPATAAPSRSAGPAARTAAALAP